MTKHHYSFIVGLIGTLLVLLVAWGIFIAMQPTLKSPPPPTAELPEPVETTVVAASIDPVGPFAKSEKVRFTLEVSEKGEVKFRAEKTDGRQTPTFDGQTVVLPGFPKLDVKTRPDGISRVVYDFRSPLPTPLFQTFWNYATVANTIERREELDTQAGKFTLRPNPQPLPDKHDDGWSSLGLKEILRLPVKLSMDATITHRGECCNFEMLCSRSVFACQVFAHGEKVEDDMKVICRIGDSPNSIRKRVYKDLLTASFTLSKPYEAVFVSDQLKNDADQVFRGNFGRNLNRPPEITRTPLEINGISFEGRLDLPK